MNTLSEPAYDNNTIDALVTIIVPVYNVEKYLHKCVDSLLEQTYKNLEIFLIDDGSTDKSGYICDEYACKDNRIKVIHKLNGGLGSARNMALSLCKGDYIAFVDSDDWVTYDFIETLLKYCDEMTLSCCGYYQVYEEVNIPNYIKKTCVMENIEFIDTMDEYELKVTNGYKNNPIGNYVCNKLWHKHAFDNIEFPSCKYEDCHVILDLILKFDKITIIPQCLYYYRQREGSITNVKTLSNALDFLNSRLFQEKKLLAYNGLYKKSQLLTAVAALELVKCNDFNNSHLALSKKIIKKRLSLMMFKYKKTMLKLLLFLVSPTVFRYLYLQKDFIYRGRGSNKTH